MTRWVFMWLVVAAFAACGGGAGRPAPAELDTRHDACATCRMSVSSQKFAGQIVAAGEEPRFFDDIGCLARYLSDHGTPAAGTMAYVADHRTGAWVAAASAVYTNVPTLDTPMASHLVAHESAASRDADTAAQGGSDRPVTAVFPAGVPDGRR